MLCLYPLSNDFAAVIDAHKQAPVNKLAYILYIIMIKRPN